MELRVTLVMLGGAFLLSLLDFALLMLTPENRHLIVSLMVYIFVSKSKQIDFQKEISVLARLQ